MTPAKRATRAKGKRADGEEWTDAERETFRTVARERGWDETEAIVALAGIDIITGGTARSAVGDRRWAEATLGLFERGVIKLHRSRKGIRLEMDPDFRREVMGWAN